jgi:hypothetical protein
MIPLFLVVRVQWMRLWIPLFILWILLLPLVLVLAPIAVLACLIVRMNALRAFLALWRVLSALRGINIDLNDGEHSVAVRIV